MKKCRSKRNACSFSAAAVAVCAAVAVAPRSYCAEQPAIPLVPAQVSKAMQDKIWEAVPSKPSVAPKKPRRVLVFTRSDHCGVWCGLYAFQALGIKSGAYEPVPTDDPAMLLPEKLAEFDAVVFNNTGIPSDRAVMNSVLDYIEQGGGIAGTHTAMLNYGPGMEYRWLWGAGYAAHPWCEEIGIKPAEPAHPLAAAFKGQPTRLREETYQFCDPYSRGYMRVLLAINVPETDMSVKQKPGWIIRSDDDFALAWLRTVGLGRLFYSALGHMDDVFFRPDFMQFYLDCMQFVTGDYEVPATPSAWGELPAGKFDADEIWRRIEKSLPAEETVMRNQCPAKFLPNDLTRERIVFLRTIPYYAGAAATPLFLEAIQDENQQVRMAALKGLGALGDPQVLTVLAEAACSVDPVEKDAARYSMARMRGEGVEEAMFAFVQDADELPELRCEVIAALGMRGARSAAPALLKTARDSDRGVRLASLAALEQTADAEAAPALLEILKNTKTDEELAAAAKALAAAIRASGAKEQDIAAIVGAWQGAEPAARRGLLMAMSGTGGAAALETVKSALSDPDKAVAASALQALAQWPDPSPAEKLLDIAEKDGDAERRAMALAGYIRMIGLKLDAGIAPPEACALYESAMNMAERSEEKKLVLQGLARTPAPETLSFIEQYLEELKTVGEDALLPNAETAYVEAAILLAKTNPKKAKEALEMFAGSSKNKELVERAVKAAQEIK